MILWIKPLKEKEEAESRIRGEFESQIMSRDMGDHLNKVPFDFSDVDDDKLEEVAKIRTRTLKSVFDTTYKAEYVDGKIVVKDFDGNVLKNQATLEPVPVSDVLNTLAKELGLNLKSPESGGQGGSSSGKNGSRFKDVAEFQDHCAANNIVPTSAEGLALLKDSGLKLY
jgi:hypothetical protein